MRIFLIVSSSVEAGEKCCIVSNKTEGLVASGDYEFLATLGDIEVHGLRHT